MKTIFNNETREAHDTLNKNKINKPRRIGRRLSLLLPVIIMLLFCLSCGKKERPNILLVTIDTLRADHVGVYGYPRDTTPFIDSLARQGVVFQKTITPLPITDASHATILTSLHPLTHGLITNGEKLNDKVQLISELLKENGYYTIGATGAVTLSKKNNFEQGFDSFSSSYGQMQRVAGKVNKDLCRQLDEYFAKHKEKPLFIWLHYFDPHTPYLDRKYKFKEPIPRHMQEKSKDNLWAVNYYDSEIRYVDESLKTVYNYLKQRSGDKKLLTCITADHGEQFGEHGFCGGHYDFYSETTFVPLIFSGYRVPQGKVVGDLVTSMDIAETIARIARVKFKYPVDGKDLLELVDQPGKYADREFLVLGHPADIKSLQLVKYPYSYILNYDQYYRYWYTSARPVLDPALLKKLNPQYIEFGTAPDAYVSAQFPYQFKPGLEYLVMRVKIREDKDYAKKVRVLFNYRLSTQVHFDAPMAELWVVHPVTTLDRYSMLIKIRAAVNTSFYDLAYVVLPVREFQKYLPNLDQQKNDMFKILHSLRRESDKDELYDLRIDRLMDWNLMLEGNMDYKAKAGLFKNLLFQRFQYFYNKGLQLFGERVKIREMSDKDKGVLKSLGYLE